MRPFQPHLQDSGRFVAVQPCPQHNDIVQVLAGIPADAPDDAGFNEKEEQQADIKAYFQKPPYKSRDFMEEGKAMLFSCF